MKTNSATLVQAGWNDEGIGWLAPLSGGKEVYRLYNPNGDHHYTMDANERDFLVSAGWNDEGIGWFSADEEDAPNSSSGLSSVQPESVHE